MQGIIHRPHTKRLRYSERLMRVAILPSATLVAIPNPGVSQPLNLCAYFSMRAMK